MRLRWGFLDEWIPAPWVYRGEPVLHDLMQHAHAQRAPLDVVRAVPIRLSFELRKLG